MPSGRLNASRHGPIRNGSGPGSPGFHCESGGRDHLSRFGIRTLGRLSASRTSLSSSDCPWRRRPYHSANSHIEYCTAKGAAGSMDGLDWMARVSSHLSDHHEHLRRYYGRHSKAAGGKGRKKEAQRALHPTQGDHPREGDSQAEGFSRQRRRSSRTASMGDRNLNPASRGQELGGGFAGNIQQSPIVFM